jgi:hypothetical protein
MIRRQRPHSEGVGEPPCRRAAEHPGRRLDDEPERIGAGRARVRADRRGAGARGSRRAGARRLRSQWQTWSGAEGGARLRATRQGSEDERQEENTSGGTHARHAARSAAAGARAIRSLT